MQASQVLFSFHPMIVNNPLLDGKQKSPLRRGHFDHPVENIGFEPITSSLPAKRSSQMS